MKFPIRILSKRLHLEQTLAAKGADRFAPKRVKELKEAIEVLISHKTQNKMKTLIEGHRYELNNFEGSEPKQIIQFIQKTPQGGTGELLTVADGTTNEEILEMLIDRMQYLQTKFPCRENAIAITNMEQALMWLNKRTADRVKRNVEGKHLS